MTLKVTMVRVSVRMAAWAITQRSPSTMSLRMLGGSPEDGSRPCAGRRTRSTSRTLSTMQVPWVTNGSARPSPNSRAPTGGPASWLKVTMPVISRALATPRLALRHDHREQGRGRGVRERLPHPEQEHRRQHHGDVDLVGDDRADQDGDDDDAAQVGDGHQPTAVDPVGDDAGEQAEEEEREVLQHRGERDQERVTRLRGDEQRPGRDLEAVGDVAHPARGEQPPERGAEPGRHHGLDDVRYTTLDARRAP